MSDQVRQDALDMIGAVGRADDLSLRLRSEVGLDGPEYGEARSPRLRPDSEMRVRGLQVNDIDSLLRGHADRAFHEGLQAGMDEMREMAETRHRHNLGEYTAATCELVVSDVMARVVTAAVKAHDARQSTRRGIVDAVIAAVKAESAALTDMAARARRGELFS